MRKVNLFVMILAIVFIFSGIAFGQELFSENWETGTIDSSKWDVGGSPTPVIHSGGHNSNYALDHNGDTWCLSAAHTKTWFSTVNGLVAEFWLKPYQCPTPGCNWSNILAGFTEMQLTDNQYCAGENWYDQIVGIQAHSGAETINYYVVGNGYIFVENYPDYNWHKYKIEINSNGYVSFYRDDQLKATSNTPINFNTYSSTKFQVWGYAYYGAMLIDDITISTYEVIETHDVIEFSGYKWNVKHPLGRKGPGNNLWSNRESDVWVDDEGRLHLKIVKGEDGNWYCTEVYTEKSFGYGTYIFYLATELEDSGVPGEGTSLDKNVVLGFFTWDDNTCETNANSEIDIELARWHRFKDPENGDNTLIWNDNILNYSVQPTGGTGTGDGCIDRNNITDKDIIPMELSGSNTTHIFRWMPGSVKFNSNHGHGNLTPYPIGSWLYNKKDKNCRKTETCGNDSVIVGILKTTKDTKVHINLWLLDYDKYGVGNPPKNEQHVIINKFKFIPASVPWIPVLLEDE